VRPRVVVIGAGMGGLAAALRLARLGFGVTVLEARAGPGGLASGLTLDGFPFDAGPYILLDRPGLEWAFHALGIDLAERVPLVRIEPHVYEVEADGAPTVRISADLHATADGIERAFPGGAGERYVRFVDRTRRIHDRLRPLLFVPRPGAWDLVRTGAIRHALFLARPLGAALAASGLPAPVRDALGIWTHVAGQRADEAPSPLAFVPALIHSVGAFYPSGGMGSIPRVLADEAGRAGAEVRYGERVRAIVCRGGRARAVETERGEAIEADAILSDAGGVGTYLDLARGDGPAPGPPVPERVRERLAALPLQSPGVCAYLAVKGRPAPPYLRFRIGENGRTCRLLVAPGVLGPGLERDGRFPARLISPMAHEAAERGGEPAQRAHLEALLADAFWRRDLEDARVLGTRIPLEWGRDYRLHRDSMNPVMTARFMREGRLAHRSPFVRGLYLAGRSTHPGQWVSFCAVSGVHAAECAARSRDRPSRSGARTTATSRRRTARASPPGSRAAASRSWRAPGTGWPSTARGRSRSGWRPSCSGRPEPEFESTSSMR